MKVTFIALAAVVGSAAAQTDFNVQKVVQSQKSGRVGLIIRSDKPLSSQEEAQLGQFGGYIYRRLPIIQSTAVSVPVKNLKKVLAMPFVKHVSEDLTVKKNDAYTVSSSGADTAWDHFSVNGKGVGVAIVDSGIRSDKDFGRGSNSRIVAKVNFSPDANTTDDLCGHGTHVAGIVAGNGESSTGNRYTQTFYGIAPKANLINVRVLNGQGGGTVSQVIAGLQWIYFNRNQYNIRIVNLSLGHPVGESYKTDPLCQAAEALWKSGLVVVCSAGNEGRLNASPVSGASNEGYGTNYGSIQSPGNDPYVITVGAMKQVDNKRAHDQIATYSSRGPSRLDLVVKPDIVAAGNNIVSVLADDSYIDQTYSSTNGVPWAYYVKGNKPGMSNDYFRMSGTSMSTPVVSGAIALMLDDQANLSPDTIKARLMVSADKWTTDDGSGDALTYGAGYLDIPGALRSNVVTTKYALSPAAARQANGHISLSLDRAIWGNSTLDSRALWGDRAIWGNEFLSAPDERALWGNSIWTDTWTGSVNSTSVDLSATALRGD